MQNKRELNRNDLVVLFNENDFNDIYIVDNINNNMDNVIKTHNRELNLISHKFNDWENEYVKNKTLTMSYINIIFIKAYNNNYYKMSLDKFYKEYLNIVEHNRPVPKTPRRQRYFVLISEGELCSIRIETQSIRLIKKQLKFIAKYAKNQKTTIQDYGTKTAAEKSRA